MKRFIQTGIVIGTAFVLWQVSADARFLDLKKQEQAPASVPQTIPTPQPHVPIYNSEVEPQGISLRFENLSLINVLRNIQEETGIFFPLTLLLRRSLSAPLFKRVTGKRLYVNC